MKSIWPIEPYKGCIFIHESLADGLLKMKKESRLEQHSRQACGSPSRLSFAMVRRSTWKLSESTKELDYVSNQFGFCIFQDNHDWIT